MLLAFSSCTSQTEFGKCVGYDDKKDSNLVYKVSGWNLIVGLIFSEMVIPPILVFVNELECPIGVVNGR